MANRTVVVLGDDDIRSQVRATLKGEQNVDIVAEFSALQPRHIGYINEMAPDIVILDCSSRTINPLLAMAELARTEARPKVVAVLADDGVVDVRAISRLNPSSFVYSPNGLRNVVHGRLSASSIPVHGVAA